MVEKEDLNQEYQLALHRSLSEDFGWKEANAYAYRCLRNCVSKELRNYYLKQCTKCGEIRTYSRSRCRCGNLDKKLVRRQFTEEYYTANKGPEEETLNKMEIEQFKKLLTEHDLKILSLLLSGKTQNAISISTGLNRRKVRDRVTYLTNMYNKFRRM